MLFRHSSIYILAKIIPAIMAFVALSLYTHLLRPDEYGIYTLIFTGTVLLHNVFFNWLGVSTLRFWSNKQFSREIFTNTLAKSYLQIALILLAVAGTLILYFWGESESIWVICSYIFLLALALFTLTQNLFTAKIKPEYYAYLTISYSILALGLGTLFAYLGFGASGVIVGIALGYLIPSFFVFKKTWLPYKKEAYSPELFKNLFTYGLPLASAALFEELTRVSDRFMLATLQDKTQAGLYSVGYDLSGNSILMIMSAINLAAYPIIIKLLDNKGKEAAMDYFRHYTVLLLGIAIPAVIGLNMVGPDLVYLLIAPEYYESVIYLLPWITMAVFLMGLQAFYFDLAFQLGHYVIAIVKIGIIISIVNISLNYWLIPIMGIKGAAVATLSSFALGSILSALMGRKHFKLPFPFKEFAKILVAALIMGACLWSFKDLRGWGWLILQLTIGITSYGIMMIIFNILDIRTQIKERLFS